MAEIGSRQSNLLSGRQAYGDKKRAASALQVASKSQRFRKQAQRWLERIQEDGKLVSAKPKQARALAN